MENIRKDTAIKENKEFQKKKYYIIMIWIKSNLQNQIFNNNKKIMLNTKQKMN